MASIDAQIQAELAKRQPKPKGIDAQIEAELAGRTVSRETARTRGDALIGAGKALEQGLSVGFGDELTAGMDAAGKYALRNVLGIGTGPERSFSDYYSDRLAQERGRLGEFRQKNPIAAAAFEVAGAVPTAVIAPMGAGTGLARVLSGAAGGAGYGTVYGTGSAEGGPGGRATGALTGAALGGALGGAVPALTGALRGPGRAVKRFIKDAPSTAALRDMASKLYKQADDIGATIDGTQYMAFFANLEANMTKEGVDRVLHPKMFRMLEIARQGAVSGEPMTLTQLHTLRRQFATAAKSIEPDERRLASEAIARLDDFVEGQAGRAGGIQKEARELWARMRKSDLIEETIEKATTRAAGVEAGLRNEFSKLYRNKKLMRGFTEAEKKAIKAVGEGTMGQNVLRRVGQLGGGSGQQRNMLPMMAGAGGGGAAGAAVGGPAGAAVGSVAVPALAYGAGRLAEAGTRNRAALARAIAASGQPAPVAASNPIAEAARRSAVGAGVAGRNPFFELLQ